MHSLTLSFLLPFFRSSIQHQHDGDDDGGGGDQDQEDYFLGLRPCTLELAAARPAAPYSTTESAAEHRYYSLPTRPGTGEGAATPTAPTGSSE